MKLVSIMFRSDLAEKDNFYFIVKMPSKVSHCHELKLVLFVLYEEKRQLGKTLLHR